MKRVAAIMAALLALCVILAGCGDDSASNAQGARVKGVEYEYFDGSKVRQPRVEGLRDKAVQDAINKEIEKRLVEKYNQVTGGEKIGSTEESFTYDIEGNLLSIVDEGYYYVPGAAHGLPYRTYMHIDTKTGQFYELADLFNTRDYKKTLVPVLRKKLQEKLGADWLSHDVPMALSHFYLSDDELVIVFDPYAVAAYAYGFVEVAVPFEEIKDIINFDSPILKAKEGL